jgi:hypothetical protein
MQGEAVRSEVKYTDNLGNERIAQVPVNESATVIEDWASGLSYRTLYLPEPNAIDMFHTDWINVEVVTPESLFKTATGYWKFDDPANLGKAEWGTPIEIVGNVTLVDGPGETDKAARIEIGKENYLKVFHDVPFAADKDYVEEWTLMVVFRAPNDISEYHTILQTDLANSNDADFFIRNGEIGIGALSYVGPALEADKWYRLIITRDASLKISSYVNKVAYHNGANASDGRFNWQNAFLISGDESNEDKTLDVAEIAVWSSAFDASTAGVIDDYQQSKD